MAPDPAAPDVADTMTTTSGVDGSLGPVSVRASDLHIRYRVYSEAKLTMRELAGRGFRRRQATEVHAVRGVSFEIRRGEAVGVLGSNGSGKSTLLRSIAGLQTPSEGSVLVRSRPRMLGVGATLRPELSGRRNIVLGALAMGIRHDQIDECIDDVIEFGELEAAIDRPLKTYSSGMRARLAFGIATLHAPEIMLIDEALAVGDRRFRKRSLDRLGALRDAAGTIVMVTHNLNEIRQNCNRAIWLDQGRLVMDGAAGDVIDAYTDDEGE